MKPYMSLNAQLAAMPATTSGVAQGINTTLRSTFRPLNCAFSISASATPITVCSRIEMAVKTAVNCRVSRMLESWNICT